MSTVNLGRVQGGGIFYSTASSGTSIAKSTITPTSIVPLVGDCVMFPNGDLREITAVGTTNVTCGDVITSFKGATGSTSSIVKTAAEWESQNPVLGAGKFGYDSTNKITKIGDGGTAWNNLPFFLSTQKSFANATWEEINNLVINNAASIYYNVGDEKTISLSTGEEITLVILGFNHDDLSDGSGKAGITLGMKGVLSTLYPMNSSYTNAGGWAEMSLRTTLQTTIFNQLPDDLKPVIKSVTKRSIADDRYTHTDTDDTLFLLSIREITGTDQYDSASHAEGSQYEYWLKMDGGTNADNRIKRNSVNNGVDYWTRTKYYGNTYAFAYISSSGNYQQFVPVTNNNNYVSFCFCI